MIPSYRNQFMDLQCKSSDWFLYEENTGLKRVQMQTLEGCNRQSPEQNYKFTDYTD